jgi:hypothetical protein
VVEEVHRHIISGSAAPGADRPDAVSDTLAAALTDALTDALADVLGTDPRDTFRTLSLDR